MAIIHGLRADNLRGDIYGGITAAVVALPLALAFGVASGAGAVAGLYGAIFVGFFAALFGGTPAQVSGPTGPMTVVMAGVITQYAHEPALAFTVVMLAGLMQIAFGLARLGRYVELVPFPVISGFMTGIGCIIISLELAPLFGFPTSSEGVLAALEALPAAVAEANPDALIVGLIAVAICFLTPPRLGRIVPAPLLALLVGTLLVLFWLPAAPVIGDIPTGLPQPRLPTLSLADLSHMAGSALVLALLGAIDSLLTSLVADNITQTRHDSNRELIGQGIGNAVAGLFGGIPGAGATMRTVINVRTGGRTPLSGALHALVLLGIALGLGGYAAHIPQAVLAGILLKVGVDIVDWAYLRRLPRAPRDEAFFMLLVAGLTVFVDLIVAVGVGVVMASLMLTKRLGDLGVAGIREVNGQDGHDLSPQEREALQAAGDRVVLYRLSGPLSFGAARGLGNRLMVTGNYDIMVVDLSDVPMMDGTAARGLEDAVNHIRAQHRRVFLSGLRPPVKRVLLATGVYGALEARHIYRHRLTALRRAAALAAERPAGTPQAA